MSISNRDIDPNGTRGMSRLNLNVTEKMDGSTLMKKDNNQSLKSGGGGDDGNMDASMYLGQTPTKRKEKKNGYLRNLFG